MKVRDAIKLIEDNGWFLVRTRGSHRHFKHPTKEARTDNLFKLLGCGLVWGCMMRVWPKGFAGSSERWTR